jgi:hypothetical protein
MMSANVLISPPLPSSKNSKKTKQTHPKKHKHAKHLDPKPYERPPHQNQQHARPKRQRALPLVLAGEKHKCSLGPEEQGDADEEEDVAHGEQGAVEEEDQAEEEEEAAARAEGDADFCADIVSEGARDGYSVWGFCFCCLLGTYSASRRATLSAWWARGMRGEKVRKDALGDCRRLTEGLVWLRVFQGCLVAFVGCCSGDFVMRSALNPGNSTSFNGFWGDVFRRVEVEVGGARTGGPSIAKARLIVTLIIGNIWKVLSFGPCTV